MQDYEKLGAFYLGKKYDLANRRLLDELLMYDSQDLTTHGVCVGMTGSGKTGLCLALLEEAAIDGIPAIAIDPKGDLGNLLLAFPELKPADFQPWIERSEADRQGLTLEQLAAQESDRWRRGLADWGQSPERIAKYRNAVDVAIYTPGSTSGLPLTVLQSFAAPPEAVRGDAEALRERVSSAAAGLLALLGIDADPLRSREQILIANVLEQAWRGGLDLDLSALIAQIQKPPFDRVGVMDVETFFPAKERFALSLSLNNLLASPGFAGWLEGESLDVNRLLYTVQGRPRLSIISIAHLSEAERMFFVTILLNEILSWVRTQAGTSTLRALLYMDEVFGYFPPIANPPSKTPMLTLLKQARAYGLGIVLATQNPVDLDYKGLANAGTWFLGRLQTERDKARVLDGLEGASAQAGVAFDRQKLDGLLSALGQRVFLMNNVHEDHPVVFQSRWALSYLRGPLTRQQIQQLTEARRRAEPARPNPPAPTVAPAAGRHTEGTARGGGEAEASGARPLVPPEIPQHFWPRTAGPTTARLVYRPALLAQARLHYVDSKSNTDTWQELAVLAEVSDIRPADPWSQCQALDNSVPDLEPEPEAAAEFQPLPAEWMRAQSYAGAAKELKDFLYRERPLVRWSHPPLKLVSGPGETEGDFRIRVQHAAREQRDAAVEKLRKSYAPKLKTLTDRLRRAEERVAKEQQQYQEQKLSTVLSLGTTVLGALFGRKLASVGNLSRAASTVRGANRSLRERQEVGRAAETVEVVQADLAQVEAELQAETARLQQSYEPDHLAVEELALRPKKSEINVASVALVWMPWYANPNGTLAEAWR